MAPRFVLEGRDLFVPNPGEWESEEKRVAAVALTAVLCILGLLLLIWIVFRLGSGLFAYLQSVPRRFRGLAARCRLRPRHGGVGVELGVNKPQQQRARAVADAHEMNECSHGQAVDDRTPWDTESGPAPNYEERLPRPPVPPPAYGTWTPRQAMPQADDEYHVNGVFYLPYSNRAFVWDPSTSTWVVDRYPRYARFEREA
ncbi:hypothetical protein HRG_008165 [Hirsutella rhossiliensis]|uniref:Uncharacterized protein n=1 Tax=Hirsutella rhossiliensis TaxID=111463 RepID=A0A9P8MTX8_9HYPO|nr:uncharacterized protein HRG_08165 [Hirsutella rhossiliensis]KAH0961012.1 hypothetical protein HRG_08165 [Hirsutella rhossiliensis]